MPTQGSERLAKDDTVFYASAATPTTAELLTDLSQYGVDWTQAGATSVIYSTESTLFEPRLPRVVEVHAAIDSSPASRVLWSQGGNPNTDANSSGITVRTAFNQVLVLIDATAEQSISLPGASGTDEYVIVWTSMENPDSTGASDFVLSEIHVWNLDTGDFDKVTWTHADFPTPAANRMFFGGYNTTGTLSYPDDIHACRVSFGRWHTTTEGREDWVAQTAVPTTSLQTYREQVVPPSTVLGLDGRVHGPEALLCSSAVRQNKLRLVGPPINQVLEDRPWIDPGLTVFDASDRLTFDTDYICPLPYMRMAKIPNVVNRCRPRVFIQHDMDTTLSDTGDDETEVSFWTGVRRPTSSTDDDFELYQARVTLDTDDGSSDRGGAWVDFGEMRMPRDDAGFAYFWMGFDFNGTAQDQRLRVKAIAVDLGFDTVTEGELPIGGLGGG